MGGSGLSDRDKQAWRAVARTVKPLGGSATSPPAQSLIGAPAPVRKVPAPKTTIAQTTAKLSPEHRGNDRAVRRGKQSFTARLDLHGYTQERAWTALPKFLERNRAAGARCVLVITGKGVDGRSVLRRNFLQWLELPHARSIVSGYAPAHPKHGGGGAFYVFLRRK